MFKSSTISGPVAVAGLAFMLALGGCSSGSDAPPEPEVTEPMPDPDPEPTDLETTQMAAKAAADAAKMASDDAATAASGANAATANSATLQTGAMAEMHAMNAGKYAKMAMDAYMAAKAASDAAAAATLASAAGGALEDAKDAQKEAEDAAKMASDYAMKATDAAKMELMIDGTMKRVGETTLDAGAANNVSTTGSGATEQKVVTGLISSLTTTGPATYGRAGVDANPTVPTAYKSPMVNAAERDDLKIGKEVDSADDAARLTIITAYAGTQTVRVYADDASGGTTFVRITASDGTVTTAADGNEGTAADATTATLKPVGMFYHAENGASGDGVNPGTDAAAIEPMGRTTADPPVQQGDTVAADTTAVQVYQVGGGRSGHAILVSTDSVEGGNTTQTYRIVDIYDEVNRDGLGVTGADGDEDVHVTAKLPAAMDYSHVHFGVWASLGEASKSGDQKITDLGIGFVQSIGDGPSGSDMPNTGTATYTGNWAAAVQDATGALNLRNGGADISANLDKGEITATLANLATLSGDIAGNAFSGTKASKISGKYGLDTGSSFTGSFEGGFYGAKAEETAAIFDFSSKNGGAFRGAFGGAAKDE